MKKLFTLLTLLVFLGGGKSWGQDLSIGATAVTTSTFLGEYSAEGITISSTSSWSDGYVALSNTPSAYDAHYLQIAANKKIESVQFLISGNGNNKSIQAPVFGWASTPSSSTADTYRILDAYTVAKSGYGNAHWFEYDFSASDVKYLRIYRSTKYVSSTSPEYTGGNSALGSGQTIQIYGIKIWLLDAREPLTISFAGEGGATSVTEEGTLNTSLSWLEDTSSESAKYTVSYKSSNEAVATVNTTTGVITGVAEGAATITATVSAAEDATYKTTKASLSVNVYNPANIYTLSSASESISLEKDNISGQPYLNVSADKWGSSGAITWDGLSGNFFNINNTDRILTIKVKGVTAFAVREQNATAGRTYGISVDGVEKKVITHGGTGVESSGIIETGSTDVVTITINGKGTGSTYPIRILLYQETVDATVGTYEWATFSNASKALDFTGVIDVDAYLVTGHSGTAITKTKLTGTVPANTGLLLNGEANTYTIPVVASSSTDVSANLLKAGDGSSISAESGKTKYVLGVESEKATFLKIVSTPATVPTGKAYLEFNEKISAREFLDIDIDGVSTGINMVNGEGLKVNGSETYYDLQGRRVLYPTKGLYIVNGKKVVIK